MSSGHSSSVLTVKTLKTCKKKALNVQNIFISDKLACSQSTLGYLWDAIGITMPNSWNMLSETSAVIFFAFFNFFFLIDFLDGKGVGMAHFGHANCCIFGDDMGK